MSQPIINLYHGDCMEAMREMEDNQYDLAIVDPPYGIGNTTTSKGNKNRKTPHKHVKWNSSIPSEEYFTELLRVSKNQIIWGANYMHPHIPHPGRVIHYKDPFQDPEAGKIHFCVADIASQSFDNRIELFKYRWYGNHQGTGVNWDNSGPDARIHPTQKPIALYKWLLRKYTDGGGKILDTHGGSMSIAIACHDMGFDLDLWELDEDYYKAGVKRFEEHKQQLKLF